MLAVSTLRDARGEVPAESFPIKDDEISDGNFLQDFDFDDFFISIDDGDILPDLEMDTEMLADFSVSSNEFEANVVVENAEKEKREEEEKVKGSPVSEETAKREESTVGALDSGKANRQKNNKGKRKVKVDWTPELHRRFVQAVEQLGLDKAVPSRILELMGIDCLTRHNIASHLQKYRSHRKHLLAREAEAASWSQRRQIYGGGKRDGNPWIAAVPSMGFPPPSPIQPFRPLHVWGHPTVDQSLIHVWPKHLLPLPPPPPWAPPPPSDPSFWHHHHLHRASKDAWVQNTPTPGTPCFPQPLTTTRLSAPPVPGILPPILYKPDNSMAFPQSGSQRQFDFHPSKETIDAAIGDVLAKPWLPLPLGLKPPSPESVLVELQRQGISKLPPSCS